METLVLIVLAIASGAAIAQSSHRRPGYVTKNGGCVAPSDATNPKATKPDNGSTKGNVHPYTGKQGTVDPYKVEPQPGHMAPKSKC